MRPSRPLPAMVVRSMPASRARRRVAGEAITRRGALDSAPSGAGSVLVRVAALACVEAAFACGDFSAAGLALAAAAVALAAAAVALAAAGAAGFESPFP